MKKNHPAFLYRLCFNVFYFLRSCNAYIILIEKASRFENNQIEMNDEGSTPVRDKEHQNKRGQKVGSLTEILYLCTCKSINCKDNYYDYRLQSYRIVLYYR